MTISMETVRMAKSRPRKNQTERPRLPCHIIIGLIKLRDGLSTEAGLSEFQYEEYQYFLKNNDIYWNLRVCPWVHQAGLLHAISPISMKRCQ